MPYLVPQQLGIHPSLQEGPENLSALCHHYSLQSCLGMSFIQFFSHLPHCRCQQEQPISWTHSHGQTAAVSEPSLTQHPSPFRTAQNISQPSTTTTTHSLALVHLSPTAAVSGPSMAWHPSPFIEFLRAINHRLSRRVHQGQAPNSQGERAVRLLAHTPIYSLCS